MRYLILDELEATAARLPEKTAFADPEDAVSFSALIASARRIASGLLENVPARSVVAFYMDKSALTLTGFMGAVYAGCAYSQMNLAFPAPRLQAIVAQLGAPVIVTDRAHLEQIASVCPGTPCLLIETLLESPEDAAGLAARRGGMTDIDPLYVNFTSGSTGTPKGVAVCHRSVLDFIRCFTEIFAITERDVIANQAPFDFDVSVKDIYSGLLTGATVQVIPTAYFIQPTKLMDFLCDRETTVLIWAVSALCFLTTMNALAYRCPTTLRTIMFSGEVMPIKHLKKLQASLPEVQYVNLYGPTEITCNCTYYIVDRDFSLQETLPIGIPFPNERILLLDENDREVREADGVGELCVSGTAVVLGYYNDPERTAQVFVQNPLNPHYPEIIYRTGDLVRLTEGGEMVYVSRKDHQIKHLGHRIELTEIENALTAAEGVTRACVIYLHDKKRIIAFVQGESDKEALLAALGRTLPEYMMPNRFVFVEGMPLNKNGKIDRARLEADFRGGKK